MARVGVDRLHMQLVVAEIIFSIVEYLSSFLCACERRVHISRNNWSVIDKVHQSTSMLSQDDLLLGTLNRGCKVVVVGLLKLLTSL